MACMLNIGMFRDFNFRFDDFFETISRKHNFFQKSIISVFYNQSEECSYNTKS